MTTFLKVTNNAISTLDGAINDSVTTLVVQSGDGVLFPSTYPFHITIQAEILSCTFRSVDTLTVVRAQQDTTAATHADGTMVQLKITAKHFDDITDDLARLDGLIVDYKEAQELAALTADYNAMMADERHTSNRRGYEVR